MPASARGPPGRLRPPHPQGSSPSPHFSFSPLNSLLRTRRPGPRPLVPTVLHPHQGGLGGVRFIGCKVFTSLFTVLLAGPRLQPPGTLWAPLPLLTCHPLFRAPQTLSHHETPRGRVCKSQGPAGVSQGQRVGCPRSERAEEATLAVVGPQPRARWQQNTTVTFSLHPPLSALLPHRGLREAARGPVHPGLPQQKGTRVSALGRPVPPFTSSLAGSTRSLRDWLPAGGGGRGPLRSHVRLQPLRTWASASGGEGMASSPPQGAPCRAGGFIG